MRKVIGIILVVLAVVTLFRMPEANVKGGYETVGFLLGVGIFALAGILLFFSGNKSDKNK